MDFKTPPLVGGLAGGVTETGCVTGLAGAEAEAGAELGVGASHALLSTFPPARLTPEAVTLPRETDR